MIAPYLFIAKLEGEKIKRLKTTDNNKFDMDHLIQDSLQLKSKLNYEIQQKKKAQRQSWERFGYC